MKRMMFKVPSLAVVGVVVLDGVAQELLAEVGVDLGGGDFLVAQHLLHGAQVGAVLHQLGGEAVTERVGRDVLTDARRLYRLLKEHEDVVAAEVCTVAVEEDVLVLARLGRDVGSDGADVGEQQIQGVGVDGHPPLLGALAEDKEALFLGIDVGEFEVHQFGDTEATAVEHLDNDVVAFLVGAASVEGGLDTGDVVVGEHIGKMLRSNRHVEQFGGVVVHGVTQLQHAVEGSPT